MVLNTSIFKNSLSSLLFRIHFDTIRMKPALSQEPWKNSHHFTSYNTSSSNYVHIMTRLLPSKLIECVVHTLHSGMAPFQTPRQNTTSSGWMACCPLISPLPANLFSSRRLLGHKSTSGFPQTEPWRLNMGLTAQRVVFLEISRSSLPSSHC